LVKQLLAPTIPTLLLGVRGVATSVEFEVKFVVPDREGRGVRGEE
jgi:hypothetical protein